MTASIDGDLTWIKDHGRLPNGRYYVRGGIGWPTYNGATFVPGHLVVVGYHIDRECYYVLFDSEWSVSEPVDFCHFFLKSWSDYFCRKFYLADSKFDNLSKLRRDLRRSAMVTHRPLVIELEVPDRQIVYDCALEKLSSNRLKFRPGSAVYSGLSRFISNTKLDIPVVQALSSVLYGMERNPWRDR